jgi:ketosteroid isomerase-like protein
MSENVVTVEAMKQIEQRWATAKDTVSMMDIFAEDAIFDNIGTQPVIGKDAIRAVYEMDEEGEKRTVENQEAVVLGSWGYSSGTWTVEHLDGRIDKGTYLNVIKLVDGEPKMFRQIFEVTQWSPRPE